jgi:hypothetical protein
LRVVDALPLSRDSAMGDNLPMPTIANRPSHINPLAYFDSTASRPFRLRKICRGFLTILWLEWRDKGVKP